MSKTFEQFHLSLIERDQLDLLEEPSSRETWLRRRFAEKFQFWHHGSTFWWVPQHLSDRFIVGVIERERKQSERTPPNEGALEIEGTFWTGSMMIIDPNNVPGGQALAFERNSKVGEPNAVVSSLIRHLNTFSALQYAIQYKPLFRSGSFWRFAQKHGDQLEYVRFKFTVPNMIFGAGGGVKKGLRRLGGDTEAQEIEVKLESEEGIRADSEAVREGVAYGEEGNATVTAKALDGERWSSTRQKVTSKVKSVIDFADSNAQEIHEWLKKALTGDEDPMDDGFDNPDRWDRDG